MQMLGNRQLQSFVQNGGFIKRTTNYNVRANRGLEIRTYPDLVERVAQLSFYNPEHVLFFRGQKKEHTTTRGNTSIKPSIFRPVGTNRVSPDGFVVRRRYDRLRRAEGLIVHGFRD